MMTDGALRNASCGEKIREDENAELARDQKIIVACLSRIVDSTCARHASELVEAREDLEQAIAAMRSKYQRYYFLYDDCLWDYHQT